jgi:capsular exopolysaccharide synthesis family protein
MSRFYQALREASRATPPPQGQVLEADRNGPDAPSPISGEEKPTSGRPPVNGVETGLAGDWSAAAEQVLRDSGGGSAGNGIFRSSSKSKLDRTARAIPNAVDSLVLEYYRRLRTKLIQQQSVKPFRTVLVTSPNPEEGKTVSVLNLGLSFAMLPAFKVLVVDGDLRKGSLGKWLGVDGNPGLSNLSDGSASLEDAVLKSDDVPVYFLPRGTAKAPAAESLVSPTLRLHFRRMTEYFSLVLVDSPPANLLTDAQLLAANCDAVLLIARAFVTNRKALERAAQDLQSFRLLGTVLNCGTRGRSYSGYRGYY